MKLVTVANRVPHEPYYRYAEFLASARRFGVEPIVLGMNEEWRGLMTKPWRLREWLRAGNAKGERLIVCDAFDIVFVESPVAVDARCAMVWGDIVVFNGEKSCWPRADLTDAFPMGASPWRFLNSGFMCGPADRILAILEAMDIESIGFDPVGGPYPNDQGEYQALFAKQPVPMVVDTECLVAQCLSGCELDEFDFGSAAIRNKVTGTEPGVFHCNGGSKEIFQATLFQHQGLDDGAPCRGGVAQP